MSVASDVPLAIEGGRPVRDTFLPFGRPSIGDEEIEAVVDVLRSGWIGMGRHTVEFERRFAAYVESPHAVAVSSCTAALHVALLAAGVGEGDEVITTPMTFAATVNAILACGARPVLVDIDRETLNIAPAAVAAAIGDRARAVLPVHFGGLPCDLRALGEIAEAAGLPIVEDAAHAVGALCDDRLVGNHGNLACFSFYPNKNITSIEGGMVTTPDPARAEDMRLLRLHGLSADAWRRFEAREFLDSLVVRSGFKYNMTDVQAVVGLAQLARLEGFLRARERHAALYDRELAGLPIDRQRRPPPGGAERHALHLYVILLRLEELRVDRDQVVRALRAENIGASVHYTAIHRHPHFREILPYEWGCLPSAEWVSDRTVTLPLSPSMTEEDARDVVSAVRRVLTRYGA